jgi:hypothetical protein
MSIARFSFLRLMIAFVLLPVPVVHAQSDAALGIEVRFFSWETPIEDLYHHTGSDRKLIVAPAYRLGPAILVKGSRELVLSQKKKREGRDDYEIVLRIALPAGASRVRVALLHTPSSGTAYHALVVPDDFNHFAPGRILALNLSPLPAIIRVGDSNHTLAPLESKVFTPPSSPHRRVAVKSGVQVDGQWKMAGEEVLGLAPGYRATVIVTISEVIGYEEGRSHARPIAFSSSEWAPVETARRTIRLDDPETPGL